MTPMSGDGGEAMAYWRAVRARVVCWGSRGRRAERARATSLAGEEKDEHGGEENGGVLGGEREAGGDAGDEEACGSGALEVSPEGVDGGEDGAGGGHVGGDVGAEG